MIFTIEKKSRENKLEMVFFLFWRKGRGVLFWPVGSDFCWLWGYHLMTLPWPFFIQSMVAWRSPQRWGYGQRTSSCGGQTRPERMILSRVYGCSTSKSSLSVLRGGQPFCVFHIVVKGKKNNIDSALKVISIISSKILFFLSWCSCLTCTKFLAFLCFSLWIFPQWVFIFCEPVSPNVTA